MRTRKQVLQHISVGLIVAVWILGSVHWAAADSFSVPNNGSPYIDFEELENHQIIHLPTGIKVGQDQMSDIISNDRVIYIGETHDNLEAHAAQLEVIRRLNEKFPGKVAVGMEMFRRSAQAGLDLWGKDELSDHEFKELFYKHWGGDYKLYASIFDYIKTHRLPLIGLKSNKETEELFREKGSDGTKGLFPEIDENDKFHRDYSMSIFGGHTDHIPTNFKPYQMLLLWEETMAETVANFLQDKRYSDWKLVVLAGGFHVQYGFGIPKRAFRRVPHAYSIILPIVTEIPETLKDRQMDVKSVAIPLYAADFGWKLPYTVLPENKIKLGVFLEEAEAGIRVRSVAENSNAARAGIFEGDVLLNLNGKPLANVEDLKNQLQTKNIGDKVLLRILRNRMEVDVKVNLQE